MAAQPSSRVLEVDSYNIEYLGKSYKLVDLDEFLVSARFLGIKTPVITVFGTDMSLKADSNSWERAQRLGGKAMRITNSKILIVPRDYDAVSFIININAFDIALMEKNGAH